MTSFLGAHVETAGTAGREQPQDTGEGSRAAVGQQHAIVFGHFVTGDHAPSIPHYRRHVVRPGESGGFLYLGCAIAARKRRMAPGSLGSDTWEDADPQG